MRGSDFAELKAFVAIVEEGSFARAAKRLSLAPSSLSQTLRDLEERLGVRLLNRTTRSLSMTEAGRRLFAGFKPALEGMQSAVEETRGFGLRPAGTVRLLTPRSASTRIVEPLLGRFFEAYPEIVLDLVIDDAVADLVEAGFDVGIRPGELLEQDMVAVQLGGDMRQIAAASPDYIARHGRPETPADLHGHRCINWRWPGNKEIYAWEFAREDGRWFSVAVNGPLIVSHRDAAVSAALQGVGIAFWSEHALQPLIDQGRLVALLEAFSPPFPGWYMTYPKQRDMPAAVRAFVDFMRREAGGA